MGNIIHGHTGKPWGGANSSPEYAAWRNMKARCGNKKNPHYPNYGGRGIRVCPEWWNSFTTFLDYIGPRPGPGYSIDRINSNVHYEPGNVRWASVATQANNTTTNRLIEYRGSSLTLAEWANVFDIPKTTLRGRLFDLKWDIHRAFTTPVRGYKRGRTTAATS